MSNRSQRRASVAAFRREVARADHLLTYLVDVHTKLHTYPLLLHAVSHWRANIFERKPICVGCRKSFAGEVFPGAFLFSTSSAASNTATTSAFCVECWCDLSDAEIEAHASRVFRKILDGRFIDRVI